MITLVVICHGKQVENLDEILPACVLQDADHRVLVLDCVDPRLESKTISQAESFGFVVLVPNHEVPGFNAGANRDHAITMAESKWTGTHFVFIDGDCVPSPNLCKHHRLVLESGVPVISCGLRKNRKARDDASPESDRRLTHPLTKNRLFVPSIDREMFDPRDIAQHHVCWSCNLGISSSALSLIRKANAVLVPGTSRVFSSVFDSKWGGEDTMLGLAGFRSGCSLVMLDPMLSWIEHIPHPTSHQAFDNLRRCHALDTTLCSGLDKTSTTRVASIARVDTLEFYNSVVETRSCDPNTVRLVESLLVADKSISRYHDVLHYMFSRNPDHEVVSISRDGSGFTSNELVVLYERVRKHIVPFQARQGCNQC